MGKLEDVKFIDVGHNAFRLAGTYRKGPQEPAAGKVALQFEIRKNQELILQTGAWADPAFHTEDITLGRGVYQIRYLVYDKEKGAYSDAKDYPYSVLAGSPYQVQVWKDFKVMYDREGTILKIAAECPVDDRSLYYTVNREDALSGNLRYYLPMRNGNTLECFIEQARPEEVSVGSEAGFSIKAGTNSL